MKFSLGLPLTPLFAIALLTGCSALGLSDDLDRDACMACEELNAIEPPPACHSWQCNLPTDPMNGNCVLDLIDRDQDNAPSAECATEERPADCDDQDPTNSPMGAEVCDLADNDCDGAIDEDAMSIASDQLFENSDLEALSFGHDTQGGLGAVYTPDSGLWGLHLPFDGTGPQETRLVENAVPGQTAITSSGSDWTVAYAELSGECPTIQLGTWDGTTGTHEIGLSALPKVGGSCPDLTTEVGSPALASASDRQVLVAYLGQRANRSCGNEPTTVAVVAAQRSETTGPFTQFGTEALSVGQSDDAVAPALLAIDPAFGYLLAFADGSGIGVHRVQVDGTDRSVTTTELYRQSCDGPCGDVSLSRDDTELALTFRQGPCGAQATAALQLLSLDTSSTSVTAVDPIRLGETANGLRRPVAAKRSGSNEWVLAWAVTVGAERSIQAQRFDPQGTPVGAPIELLSTTGTFPEALAIVAGEGLTGFRALTFDSASNFLVRASAICTPAAE